MKTVQERLAVAFLLTTMARKKTPKPSNLQAPAAPTEKTGPCPSIQTRHAILQLLLATKAGQEQREGIPCSSAKKTHLASTAVQGNFSSASEIERRTRLRSFTNLPGTTRSWSLFPLSVTTATRKGGKTQIRRSTELIVEALTRSTPLLAPPPWRLGGEARQPSPAAARGQPRRSFRHIATPGPGPNTTTRQPTAMYRPDSPPPPPPAGKAAGEEEERSRRSKEDSQRGGARREKVGREKSDPLGRSFLGEQ